MTSGLFVLLVVYIITIITIIRLYIFNVSTIVLPAIISTRGVVSYVLLYA